MKELKPLDYQLLFELMKDSHRSDRQLAKALGISQPTVTRRRAMLEESTIEGYTVIPKFGQIGFEIAAFTFMKTKLNHKKGKDKEEALNKVKEWYLKQSNIIAVLNGQGMGYDAVCVSLHENYTNFAEFLRTQTSELSDVIEETQSFQADLKPGVSLKPFSLKYLAKPKE
ncbi:MAG TPA: Lrp/AsnC family transcriptional regulator [Candidatus Nanoarchaeia archaeon]|nr:Lrp/AsnC family transcriptional regulator [Candidatus Nanoarchaeia archaeon]